MSENKHDAAEIAVAKHLFTHIDRMAKGDLPGLTRWAQTQGEFCTDLIMSAPRPSGGINILIADFVGQGLPAAVAALPVAQIFYRMTEKGFGLSDIIEEINKELLLILPEGLFCAACLIELEREGKMLAIWNGGLPDLLVLDKHSQLKHRLVSSHIPLGVSPTEKIDLEAYFVEVEAGDKVFCYTQGIIRSLNQNKQLFGQQQIETLLSQDANLATLSAAISAHTNNAKQLDDMTMLEVDIAVIQKHDKPFSSGEVNASFPPAQWQVDFNFSAAVLKQLDLVPIIMNMLMQIQAPYEHKQRIYTVLAEMFNNALEHGVLSLDSKMKQGINGFADYYALRGQRLDELSDAYIKVSLEHQAVEQGGQLVIRIEDSGNGFDYQQNDRELSKNMDQLCGRGRGLLLQLCSEYFVSGKGNIANAVYIWS